MNFDTFFGPLDKKNCLYFYILSIFFGILFVTTLISLIGGMLMYNKKMDKMVTFHLLFGLINIFVAYFVNRLLHTMCINSIH